ncbi:ABC transporter ATP-binding protein/permease [Vibrio sp. Of14-4]|uniref:ABC transporter ATP-binding protein n=1 Tax=Vibrio sp. Of14-4 TaxID=2724878 RepID=UPI001EF396D5|nr:ABC transporter ATP-binding protein [Vibrio sp. Of14-4]MCG7488012.1 ABC transporter ATP-binding protein/permease [Vibrio sp. Of14-4]
MKNDHHSSNQALPKSAKQRLYRVGAGWTLVAAFEAIAYVILALAIVKQESPMSVIIAAGIAVAVTIFVTRSGFLSGARLAGDLYSALGQSLSSAKLAWFNEKHRTQVTQLAERGIPGFMAIPAHQLQTFLHAPLLPIFLVIGIGIVGGLNLAIFSAVLLSMSLWIQYKAQQRLSSSDSDRHKADDQATQSTLELIDHLDLLRSTAGPAGSLERIELNWTAQEKVYSKINRAASMATLVSTFATILPLAGVTTYLVYTSTTQPLLILALLILITRSSAPLSELALSGFAINDVKASIKNYHQLTQVPVLSEPHKDVAKEPKHNNLNVNNVSYLDILKSVSAKINAGETVVINGPSGGGKSTLLGLLMRFDDPSRGTVSIGDIDMKTIKYKNLTQHIAYVAQDPIVFTGTLAENIRLGNPNASDQEVESFAKLAQLEDVIGRSEQGIHQTVGQRGTALSGGERQRVAIARALIKQAPVVIFDEATSALDQDTERQIAKHIKSLNSTVIVVTHREAAIWHPSIELTVKNQRVITKQHRTESQYSETSAVNTQPA